MIKPQILFGYNEGPRIYGRAVKAALRAFIKSAGFDAAMGLNTKHENRIFLRAMRDLNPRLGGSIVEFAL